MEQTNFTPDQQFMSDQVDQLATSLAKAQSEFGTASKDKSNPFFKSKFADFESVVAASRPALTKYGLSVSQNVYRCDDGNHYLITLLLHASGQWLKSKAQHNPQKNDIQSLSSYNTSLKRMCYTSLVGVVTGDMDDDGNSASSLNSNSNYSNSSNGPKISVDQVNYLSTLPEATQQRICQFNNVNHIDELTIDQYDKVVTMIKNRSQK